MALSPVEETIDSESNDIIIVFNSDLAGSLSGFKLRYSTETSGSVCPTTSQIHGASGRASSVKVDKAYGRMLTCSWLITVDAGHVIEVRINAMESDNDCLKDYMSIHDGPTIAGREIARVCGRAISKTFISSSNTMYLMWHNDEPSIEKQVTFSYTSTFAPSKAPLVQILPKSTKAALTQRVVTRSKAVLKAHPKERKPIQANTCKPCKPAKSIDRSICEANYGLVTHFPNLLTDMR